MIRNIYSKVFNTLREQPQLRSNDKLLQLSIWEQEGLYLTATQKWKFMQVTSGESITRARRKVQEDGYFIANKATRELRKETQSKVVAEVIEPVIAKQQTRWIT